MVRAGFKKYRPWMHSGSGTMKHMKARLLMQLCIVLPYSTELIIVRSHLASRDQSFAAHFGRVLLLPSCIMKTVKESARDPTLLTTKNAFVKKDFSWSVGSSIKKDIQSKTFSTGLES